MQPVLENPRVNLEIFEGPLDLLLHLIRKNDLNIYDIPIAVVLAQYVEYLTLMKELNIDLASEFLLMASELAHIKSRLLVDRQEEEEEEGPDPRVDLVARLVGYQRYKRIAQWLTSRPMLYRDLFKRGKKELPEGSSPFLAVDPFSLVRAFQEVLKRVSPATLHEIERERVSVTERIYELLDFLEKTKGEFHPFEALFEREAGSKASGRLDLVVTFLAILEMARLHLILIYQTPNFSGPLLVKKGGQEVDYGTIRT